VREKVKEEIIKELKENIYLARLNCSAWHEIEEDRDQEGIIAEIWSLLGIISCYLEHIPEAQECVLKRKCLKSC